MCTTLRDHIRALLYSDTLVYTTKGDYIGTLLYGSTPRYTMQGDYTGSLLYVWGNAQRNYIKTLMAHYVGALHWDTIIPYSIFGQQHSSVHYTGTQRHRDTESRLYNTIHGPYIGTLHRQPTVHHHTRTLHLSHSWLSVSLLSRSVCLILSCLAFTLYPPVSSQAVCLSACCVLHSSLAVCLCLSVFHIPGSLSLSTLGICLSHPQLSVSLLFSFKDVMMCTLPVCLSQTISWTINFIFSD